MPEDIIESCKECPYSETYECKGKSWRCKAPEMIKECGKHGKAIELDDWEDIADFCPLPPRKR